MQSLSLSILKTVRIDDIVMKIYVFRAEQHEFEEGISISIATHRVFSHVSSWAHPNSGVQNRAIISKEFIYLRPKPKATLLGCLGMGRPFLGSQRSGKNISGFGYSFGSLSIALRRN